MTAQSEDDWTTAYATLDPSARSRWESDVAAFVASPHFEWRRGMIDTDGAVCVDVEGGKPTIWWCEGCGGEVPEEDLPSDEPTLLDIEHAGNHGHMLALVRKAWGDPWITVQRNQAGGWAVVFGNVIPPRGALVGDTEGLALAAALLAAPPKAAHS